LTSPKVAEEMLHRQVGNCGGLELMLFKYFFLRQFCLRLERNVCIQDCAIYERNSLLAIVPVKFSTCRARRQISVVLVSQKHCEKFFQNKFLQWPHHPHSFPARHSSKGTKGSESAKDTNLRRCLRRKEYSSPGCLDEKKDVALEVNEINERLLVLHLTCTL